MRLKLGPVVLWRSGLSASVSVGGVSVAFMGVNTLSGELIRYEGRVEVHPLNACLSVPLIGPLKVSYWHGGKWPATDSQGNRHPISSLWAERA